MKRTKTYFLTAAGVAVLAASFLLSGARTSSAAPGPGPQAVIVENTSTSPVPTLAQGTTNIAGTVQATQSGSWNVGISGTPTFQVGNTAINPVFVRDVNEPGMHPYQATSSGSFIDGNTSAVGAALQVPTGKRLVIKFVTVSVGVPTGQIPTAALTATIGGVESHYDLLMIPQGTVNSIDTFVANQQVEAFSDAGATVFADLGRSSSFGTGFSRVSISGYLVDVP